MAAIFVSHASGDAVAVRESIVAPLRDAGNETWISADLRGGDNFVDAIRDQLRAADCLVVALSPGAVESKWVKAEVAAAFDEGTRIVPVELLPCDATRCHVGLASLHKVVLSGTPGGQAELIAAVRASVEPGREPAEATPLTLGQVTALYAVVSALLAAFLAFLLVPGWEPLWLALLLLGTVGLGAGADRLMQTPQRSALHEKLTALWLQLRRTPAADVPKRLAGATLRALRSFYLPSSSPLRRAVRVFLLGAATTWVLTSVAFNIAQIGTEARAGSGFPLPHLAWYLANSVFDLGTMLITIQVLRVVRDRGTMVGAALITFDLAAATALAILCVPGVSIANDIAMEQRWIGCRSAAAQHDEACARIAVDRGLIEPSEMSRVSWLRSGSGFFDYLEQLRDIPAQLFRTPEPGVMTIEIFWIDQQPPEYEAGFVLSVRRQLATAATTLVPTVLFMSALMFLMLGKSLGTILRKLIQQYLGRAIEHDPRRDPERFMPFTLLGITAAMLGIGALVLRELIARV